jgi:hypothetical protein
MNDFLKSNNQNREPISKRSKDNCWQPKRNPIDKGWEVKSGNPSRMPIVIVFSRQRIISQEKASASRAIVNMYRCDLVRIKKLYTCHPRHGGVRRLDGEQKRDTVAIWCFFTDLNSANNPVPALLFGWHLLRLLRFLWVAPFAIPPSPQKPCRTLLAASPFFFPFILPRPLYPPILQFPPLFF